MRPVITTDTKPLVAVPLRLKKPFAIEDRGKEWRITTNVPPRYLDKNLKATGGDIRLRTPNYATREQAEFEAALGMKVRWIHLLGRCRRSLTSRTHSQMLLDGLTQHPNISVLMIKVRVFDVMHRRACEQNLKSEPEQYEEIAASLGGKCTHPGKDGIHFCAEGHWVDCSKHKERCLK